MEYCINGTPKIFELGKFVNKNLKKSNMKHNNFVPPAGMDFDNLSCQFNDQGEGKEEDQD